MNQDNLEPEEDEYDGDAHMIPEAETRTHADFGGGVYKVDCLVPCNHGGVHPKSVFVMAASMMTAIEVALESFGAPNESEITVLGSTRLDQTDSRFLVPRSFLENAEESWIFKMRPRNSGEDHMN